MHVTKSRENESRGKKYHVKINESCEKSDEYKSNMKHHVEINEARVTKSREN